MDCIMPLFFFFFKKKTAYEIVDLGGRSIIRSEEHTSELQSLTNLVCRLLLEKKKRKIIAVVQHTAVELTESFQEQKEGAFSMDDRKIGEELKEGGSVKSD